MGTPPPWQPGQHLAMLGYCRHLHLVMSDTAGTWSVDIDPRDDEPFRVIDLYQIRIFDKYRLPSATAELARASR